MTNADTVAKIYEAFGRGDVPFILSCLADDVEWDNREHHGIPLLVPRRGHAGAALFFQELANVAIQSFSLKQVFDGGANVVAWTTIAWRWKPSERLFEDAHAFHLWQFDDSGKVKRFFHIEDTHAMWLASVGA